ncbi:hypothetical protein [Nocardioides albertanoniae]|nr:hypothetical protein [Nocardioides albertanoniae]
MVTEFDLRQRPSGEIERLALLEYVMSTDDRIERHFLEVKSDVDLTRKAGRGKVAKFILGAANREPAVADGYFEGHALMVLGAAHGAATGIEGFEAKDLHHDVTAWIGTDGPRWGFDRIPLEGSRDVIVVDVWPPTGDIWACRADGEDESATRLRNGEIYLRVDGETRAATGNEKHAMFLRLKQMAQASKAGGVAVAVVGRVEAVGVDLDVLDEAIVRRARQMRQHDKAFPTPRRILATGVDLWERNARIQPAKGLVAIAAAISPGIQIEVCNKMKTYLQEVQIEVKFDGNITAGWCSDDDPNLFPETPIPWKTAEPQPLPVMPSDAEMAQVWRSSASSDADREIRVKQARPAVLTIDVRVLRPHEVFETEPREVALVVLVGDENDPPSEILCTYRVSASNMDDLIYGEFVVPVEYGDWREPVRQFISEDRP